MLLGMVLNISDTTWILVLIMVDLALVNSDKVKDIKSRPLKDIRSDHLPWECEIYISVLNQVQKVYDYVKYPLKRFAMLID